MGHYILQTIAFQLFFLIIYDAFLKKETFFNWNRAYLLVTALLSIALPFIKIQSFRNVVPKNFVMAIPEITLGNTSVVDPTLATQIVTTEASKFQFSWELLFFIGAFVALTMFMFKLIKIITLIYRNPKYWSHNLRIVTLLKSNTAFSFFYYVFLGEQIKEEDKPTILKHEAIHVNHKHTLDLLFFELLRIVFWFNPLIYMYQYRIASLHEFIADAEAVKSHNKNDYYQDLLNQIFETENVSFINAFYKKSLIKKRIVMLSKAKSKQFLKLKYALLFPTVLAMLVYTSCTNESSLDDSKDSVNLEQYNYSMKVGELMSNDIKKIHEKYETFLLANPQYVSWSQQDGDYRNYSVHSKEENRPSNLSESAVKFPNGSSYVMYIQWTESKNSNEVPFSVIDEVPTFPGCENITDQKEARKCMANKITEFVQKKFNTKIAPESGLTGRQRISVIFKIDSTGTITGIRSRAPHPNLEDEAERVIGMLPKMIPGKHQGKNVIVPYSLPIIFQVAENSNQSKKDVNKEKAVRSEEIIEDLEALVNGNDLPFAVVDKGPTFPECESLSTNDEQKKCVSDEITRFVQKNFNTGLAKDLGLRGRQQISTIFKIDTNGNVVGIRSRAANQSLEEEAKRVIGMLPKFIPGEHKGKKVNVSYSLPIVFQVN
jgi:bla regulator protein BlaR1